MIERGLGRIQNEEPNYQPMTLNQFLIFLVIGIAIAGATGSTWLWWILAICTVLVIFKLLRK